MKKKLLIILTLMISVIMLTSCDLLGKIILDLGSEKSDEIIEGIFESDDVVHIAKNFVLEKEDGTTKEYGDITITKTKLVITKTEEFIRYSDVLRNGDYGYYKVELYFQINNSDYFKYLIEYRSALSRRANQYCFDIRFDEYFNEKVSIREIDLIYEPEKCYRLEIRKSEYMLLINDKPYFYDFKQDGIEEKENIVFTINKNEIGEENE